jgi:membrane fusion protein, heavy metal efflux system
MKAIVCSAGATMICCLALIATLKAAPPGEPIVINDEALNRKLVVEQAHFESVQSELQVPGIIEADPVSMVRIFPPVTGHLIRIEVQLGEAVREGQLLALLSAPDFMQAQSDFIKARSNLNLTAKQLRREQALYDAKIAANADLENAQANYEQAKSDFDTAVSVLHSYGFDPDRDPFGEPFRLISPVSGKVVDMATGKGEFKTDPTQSMMTVADLSHVWLTASVQEKDLHLLKVGQQVSAKLNAYEGDPIEGKVINIGDLLDPDLRATKVRVVLDNPEGRFKPGMFATVLLKQPPAERITVPVSAVVQAGFTTLIFEKVKSGTYIPHEVQTGESVGDRIVISKGLEKNAMVVVANGVLLQ